MTLFAQAFSGAWTCYDRSQATAWRIASAPGGAWTIVRWGDQHGKDGGIAYVGYVSKLRAWVYRDFHYDGSYADIGSPGPVGRVWTWSGPYYTGDRRLEGDITWLRAGDRIDRTFRARVGGKLTPSGRDYCVRADGTARRR